MSVTLSALYKIIYPNCRKIQLDGVPQVNLQLIHFYEDTVLLQMLMWSYESLQARFSLKNMSFHGSSLYYECGFVTMTSLVVVHVVRIIYILLLDTTCSYNTCVLIIGTVFAQFTAHDTISVFQGHFRKPCAKAHIAFPVFDCFTLFLIT